MSIKHKIILFALLATLLPAVGLGWLYFDQIDHTLRESARRTLQTDVIHAERAFLLWLRERLYDLRTFSASETVMEALERGVLTPAASSHLEQLGQGASSYRAFRLFDYLGHPLNQVPRAALRWTLPPDWRRQLEKEGAILATLPGDGKPALLMGVPMTDDQGLLEGVFTAAVGMESLAGFMGGGVESGLALADHRGRLLFASGEGRALGDSPARVASLFETPGEMVVHQAFQGSRLLVVLRPVEGTPWGVIATLDRDQLYSGLAAMREFTILVVALLVAVIGFLAWRLSRNVLQPLGNLIRAAKRVADGDLEVTVPVLRNDELGFASHIFNEMLAQLRQHHSRLETLSTTDVLTGLPNRKGLLQGFETFLARYRRHLRPFSVLMLDIDHFKRVNDRHGHLAGDQVLREVAQILVREMRQVDLVGRFGGEEFMLLLDETPQETALLVAERIRHAIAANPPIFNGRMIEVTASLGVAEVAPGEGFEAVVQKADEALYLAKQQGRNRTRVAERRSCQPAARQAWA